MVLERGRIEKDCFWLSIAAMIPRACMLAIQFANPTPGSFDQAGYLQRAQGFHAVFQAFLHLQAAPSDAWHNAYGRGIWPPLYPITYGLALFAPGDPTAIGRVLSVLFSIATLLPIYLLGLSLGGRRTAIVAAAAFALMTTFITVSTLLWSENLFILLFCWAVYLLLAVAPSDGLEKRKCVLLGLALGGACLTRAEMILPLFVILIALWRRSPPTLRLPRIGLVALLVALAVAPWQAALVDHGAAPVLSTAGWENLYIGNIDLDRELQRTEFESGSRNFNADALRNIQADPTGYAKLCAERALMYWWPDSFRAELPPFTAPREGLLDWSALLEGVILLGLAVCGLFRLSKGQRALYLWLTVALMLVPVLVLSSSRFGLPNLAILLPVAALHLRGKTSVIRGEAARP